MIYELREYLAVAGRGDELHARFREHTFELFERHGLNLVDYFTDEDNPDRIVYLLRFADGEAQQAAWQGFQADPDWNAVKAASESNGPIVAQMTSRNLVRPAYRESVRAGEEQR